MKRKKRGIKGKMTIAIIVMGILLSLCVGIGVLTISFRQVSAQYTEQAFNTATAAVLLINGDNIVDFLDIGKNEEYNKIYNTLKEVKQAFDVTYLYIVAPGKTENTAVYVFDIFTEGNDPDLIGELGELMPDSESAAFHTGVETFYSGHTEKNTVISFTFYGWLASAYVPIFASDGSVTAVLGVDISMNRMIRDILLQTLQVLLITVAIIVLFLFILRYIAGKQILEPVMRLSKHMDGFDPEEGKLETIEVPDSGDEFQKISESHNRMVDDIKYYMNNLAAVTADRERIATELNVATEIQTSMLPNIFPAFPVRNEFDIYATMHPAKEVGGDFYDFFLINKDTLAVVIADVSDKGIPAALFMVISKTLIKNEAMAGKSPKEAFESVNLQLCENNDAGMFVTAFMGYLDIPTGRLTYVNAGHNPPLIKRNGKYEALQLDSGLMLAVMEDMEYTQEETTLAKGDILYLYTDGVTEAKNKEGKLFTAERMLENANKYTTQSVNEFLLKMKEEIDIFTQEAEQADDITMLALEIK